MARLSILPDFIKRWSNQRAARKSRKLWTRLESLEQRLNLAAVLVVETPDAFWLFDDVDDMIDNLNGDAPGTSSGDQPADFTANEQTVFDELIAELMIDEGYSDDEILSVSYIEDMTSDELIASSFFDDLLFGEEFADESSNIAGFGDFSGTSELPGDNLASASSADETLVVSASVEERPSASNDSAIPPVNLTVGLTDSQNVQTGVTAAEAASTLERRLVSPSRTDAQLGTNGTAVEPLAKSDSAGLVSTTKLNAPAATTPQTRSLKRTASRTEAAVESTNSDLAFVKSQTDTTLHAGFLSGINLADWVWPTRSSSDGNELPNDGDSEQLSYSQLAVIFGLFGLAFSRWFESINEENSVQQPRTHRLPGPANRRAKPLINATIPLESV